MVSISAVFLFLLFLSTPLLFCVHDLCGFTCNFRHPIDSSVAVPAFTRWPSISRSWSRFQLSFILRSRDLGKGRPTQPFPLMMVSLAGPLDTMYIHLGRKFQGEMISGWPLSKHVSNFVQVVVWAHPEHEWFKFDRLDPGPYEPVRASWALSLHTESCAVLFYFICCGLAFMPTLCSKRSKP